MARVNSARKGSVAVLLLALVALSVCVAPAEAGLWRRIRNALKRPKSKTSVQSTTPLQELVSSDNVQVEKHFYEFSTSPDHASVLEHVQAMPPQLRTALGLEDEDVEEQLVQMLQATRGDMHVAMQDQGFAMDQVERRGIMSHVHLTAKVPAAVVASDGTKQGGAMPVTVTVAGATAFLDMPNLTTDVTTNYRKTGGWRSRDAYWAEVRKTTRGLDHNEAVYLRSLLVAALEAQR